MSHEAEAWALADRFAGLLRDALTDAQWAEMRDRNARSALGCASHDYCDANQLMLMAAGVDDDDCEELPTDLINSAWDIARANYLTRATA